MESNQVKMTGNFQKSLAKYSQPELKAKISRVKLSGKEEQKTSDVDDETQLRQDRNYSMVGLVQDPVARNQV